MTAESPENLANEEPYVTSFEATVRSVDDRAVTLDRTYFYPEGGGQPADRGEIDGVDVVDVQKADGATVHTLSSEPAFEAGDTVTGQVDEEFRRYSMRAHTASHLIYGVGRKLFDDHGYGGFDIGEERIRIDFETTDSTDDLSPLTLQRMANEVVWESRPVDWYEMDVADARADDDIVFNLGETDPSDSVRIVEIEDWDVAACGGTHVGNTSEIGPISVESLSNPGADLVRVEYAVGPRAIQRGIDLRRSAARAADTLVTSIEDLPRRAAGLLEDKQSLQADLEELRGQLLDARLASLAANTYERDGQEWLVGTVDTAGPNAVADRVGAMDDDVADTVVLAGTDGGTFVVVGTDGETDANEIIQDITAEFGGGGGGQPSLAQGGGLDADPETVVEYVRQS